MHAPGAPPDEEDPDAVTERRIELDAGTFTAAPYRAEDERAVLDLWRVAFGKELDADLWRWKYVDNPFGMRVLVCRDPQTEAAVVVYSGVPYRARRNGREVEIVQLMDIMSHPDVRKTGLFIKAAEAFFDIFAVGDSVLYYGIPGRYHFDIGAKYLDYSELEVGSPTCVDRLRHWPVRESPRPLGAAHRQCRTGTGCNLVGGCRELPRWRPSATPPLSTGAFFAIPSGTIWCTSFAPASRGVREATRWSGPKGTRRGWWIS